MLYGPFSINVIFIFSNVQNFNNNNNNKDIKKKENKQK